MAILDRISARRRLRRAARDALVSPVFSSAVDCTPWVIGGLWPAELSQVTAQTATLAAYLRADLQRITRPMAGRHTCARYRASCTVRSRCTARSWEISCSGVGVGQ